MRHLLSFLCCSFLLIASIPAFSQSGHARVVKAFHKSQVSQGQLLSLYDTECGSKAHLGAVRLFYSRNDRSLKDNWHYQVSFKLEGSNTTETLRLEEIKTPQKNIQTYVAAKFYEKEITDALKVRITGISESGSPDSVFIELDLYETTAYPFDASTRFRFGKDDNPETVLLYWDYAEGAYEYDLEWTYIDSEDGGYDPAVDGSVFDYKRPVRISTSNQHFELPLTHPSGKLYYRVRAVGRYPGGKGRNAGEWNYGYGSNGATDPLVTVVAEDFEKDKVWQAVTTYAEEGKFKKVVSYYDGSLRNRQSLTNLSSDKLTLAAESKYDYEGRPVVNVLPVPLKNNSLRYQEGLNLFAGTNRTGKSNYDNSDLPSAALDSTYAGASKYYSANNDFKTIHSAYVPTAEGYPFAQVEYKNDNTGRVTRQGGVGKTFQLGSGKETQMHYGNPTSSELQRLFGSNVGMAVRYRKNMVIDPNGQASIAYTDQEGRTIATALAGLTPSNLISLESNKASEITVNLRDNTHKDRQAHARTTTHTILNAVRNTVYTFNYSLNGGVTTTPMGGCSSCSYRFRLRITDMDEKLVVPERDTVLSAAQCQSGRFALSMSVNLPEVGSYKVTKELTLVSGSIEDIRSRLQADSAVARQLRSIETEYLAEAARDTISCRTCQGCPADPIGEAIEDVTDGECQSIFDQISAQKGGSTDIAILRTHPEWCHYEACIRNRRSTVFERRLGLVNSYDTARRVYSYPLDKNFYRNDPFFLDTLDGNNDAAKDDILNRLSRVRSHNGQLVAIDVAVADTSQYTGMSAVEKDAKKWELFSEYYVTAKKQVYREAMVRRRCGYQTHDSTIVQDPKLPDTQGDANNFVNKTLDRYYRADSAGVVGVWISLLKAECPAVSTRQADIRKALMRYYKRIDPATNPWMLPLTGTDTNGDLLEVASILNSLNCRDAYRRFVTEAAACAVYGVEQEPLTADAVIDYEGGPGAYVKVAQPGIKNIGKGDFTVEFWLKPNFNLLTQPQLLTLGNLKVYLDYHDILSADRLVVRMGATQTPLAGVGATAYGTDYKLAGTILGGCKHIAIVRDSISETESKLSYYLDGILRQTVTIDSVSIRTAGEAVKIGGGNSASEPYAGNPSNDAWWAAGYRSPASSYSPTFSGTLWDVRVWSIARDSAAIRSTRNGVAGTETGLEGNWKLKGQHLANAVAGRGAAVMVNTSNTDSYFLQWANQCCEPVKARPKFFVDVEAEIKKCKDQIIDEVREEIKIRQAKALDSLVAVQLTKTYNKCFASPFSETFTYKYVSREYHYTLYYYDQAGNLVQTVPPEGVKPAAVDAAGNVTAQPKHVLLTSYAFNSLEQLIGQQSPDGGKSQFWYDYSSKLRLSQNAKQAKEKQYSYTRYDGQTRITEVGQLTTTALLATLLSKIEDVRFPVVAAEYRLSEITQTYYDDALMAGQENLRGRVAGVVVKEDGRTKGAQSFYSYDVHGNVKHLVQKLPGLPQKTVDYDYDLISGKVNKVTYQKDTLDQFIHRYGYDSDNRLTSVFTSLDGYLWSEDASYCYYAHGPLARVELGEYKVQGLDYFYTLQGWIKGINNTVMTSTADPGKDGAAGNVHQYVSRDAFAFSLHFFNGDYKPVKNVPIPVTSAFTSLYNGNIGAMTTALPQVGTQQMNYRYDQLNRIKVAQNAVSPDAFKETFSYDGNGNILKLLRNNGAGTPIDNLTYNYVKGANGLVHNQLQYVYDSLGLVQDNDLGIQEAGNYEYDAIGNLIKDKSEKIDSIKWTLYGKVARVVKVVEGVKKSIDYSYDGTGNRVLKVYNNGSSVNTTFYIRDASGNVMAVYENKVLIEQPIYGSSRLGLYKGGTTQHSLTLGNKQYELSNHLGNVLAVITDNKNGVEGAIVDQKADYYEVRIISVTDYYAFGMAMKERSWQSEQYRYGFNGKEKDDDWNKIHYELREYDARLGRMTSVDPRAKEYPWQTTYAYHANNPISIVDYLGGGEAPKETKVGKFFRNVLPGIIAAPVGGIVDAFAGAGKFMKGIFTNDKTMRQQGSRDMLGGVLSIFGLKEVFYSPWTRSPTSHLFLPEEINKVLDKMGRGAWNSLRINPANNGMHSWHAASNAALSNKLGPVGAIGAWLVGVFHESPFDKYSFKAEQSAQGTINHILDSTTDLIANTVGMVIGLVLPKQPARWLSLRIGNLIPGPGDGDPRGEGLGGYYGDDGTHKRPSEKWFGWWKNEKEEKNGKKTDNPSYDPEYRISQDEKGI